MSGIQKIFVHPACPHCWKVLVAVEFAGITAEVVHVTWEETKKAEFLSVNPTGKVPAVITTEGALFDSHAILRTIARAVPDKNLYGKTNFEKAKVDQWLDTNSGEVGPAVVQLVYPIIGKSSTNVDEKTYQSYVDAAKTKLAPLNEYLNGKKFLVGDSITIADISLVSFIRPAVAVALDAEFKKDFPHFFTYFTTVSALPEVVKALGRARTCEKRWPLYQAPVAKKEEKKVAEKKETKKKDEEEEEVEAPKKDDSKTELENLPPSKFNFFDFKTLIVNAADKNEAMKTFWEQFDKEGYSLWFVEYEKAEGEGKVVYLTNNLMNGFLQRLEHFRKYAYAVYGVYGDEPNLEVRGVFCWRGTKIPLMIKEHDQYEYHRFTQLNPDDANDKKKVEEFWTKLNEDEDVVDGLTARTVKYFK